jgi:hypothetical protein
MRQTRQPGKATARSVATASRSCLRRLFDVLNYVNGRLGPVATSLAPHD